MTLILALALLLQDGLEKKIDAILPRLASEDLAARSAAVEELKKLVLTDVRAARRVLQLREAAQTDVEMKSTIRNVIEALPSLELVLTVEGEPKAGKAVTFKARIRNLSDVDRVVVRCLDASDLAWRYPHYLATVTESGGSPVKCPKGGRCKNVNSLAADDLLTIKPGEEVDPFGKGAFGQYVLREWQPGKAGTYTVTLTIDMTPTDPGKWHDRGNLGATYETLVNRITKVKLEAKVDVVVK